MTFIRRSIWLLAAISLASFPLRANADRKIDFNHDIRPILSNNCLTCHGPDSHQRKGKLRLDLADDAYAEHKTGTPLVPGNLEKSQVVRRITSSDPDEMMPPAKSERRLSAGQIELLKTWVSQGAKYEKHWSFIPPTRPELPAVSDQAWCSNPIDRFVLARLDQEGLKPSPAADKITLCRRLYFDLIGLPPTPAQVDAFVADTSPAAYEKVVDELLANPHYGERMALDWLDAARYADTHGYHIDSGRDQTHWRDWVIHAFNTNKPFDQFTTEQLAGDLLPNSTIDQKIATGFVRNNMVNFEGGANAAEYLTQYIMDRVNTTSMVWLGLTLNCCQCHDHKFDPFKQKEYYQLYAYFNAVPERGLDGNKGNAGPVLAVPTPAQQQRLDAIATSMKLLEEKLAGPWPEADAQQAEWEKIALEKHPMWTALEPAEMKSAAGATLAVHDDKSVVVTGINPASDTYTLIAPVDAGDITAVRLETLADGSAKGHGAGRSANGNVVMTGFRVAAGIGNEPSAARAVKIKSVTADYSQPEYPVSSLVAETIGKGWGIFPEVAKPHAAVFEFDQPIHNDGGIVLTIKLEFQSGFAEHQLGHFRLSTTHSKAPHGNDILPRALSKVLAMSEDKRSAAQTGELRKYFRTTVCSSTKSVAAEITALRQEKDALDKKVPTTMVMQEMAKPRETFILMRGQFDKHGQTVTAAVPETLAAALPAGAPQNRLGLAEWLVSRQQPLTSRVIVNRYWMSFFGTGIVKTVEDFGSQGEEPTHPELLDWLAVQFMDGNADSARWDVKGILKLIVMSSTYRQTSAVRPELLARDPENRLMARGPRIRLPAEFIRDNALAVSGLLTDEIGGKSVSPYQPAGLWEELMSRGDGANWTAQTYTQDHGKELYRRTMYTFWKRTSPPPTLATFDAPDRETCTVRRARTNTPLQALVLMNDPTYVEAARKLAERMLTECGSSTDAKILYAFRLCTSRAPRLEESAILKHIYDRELALYQKDPDAAKKLLSVGESPRSEKLDPAELAAWSTVASVILNLDETITKG